MNKAQKIAKLSEALGFAIPEETTLAVIDDALAKLNEAASLKESLDAAEEDKAKLEEALDAQKSAKANLLTDIEDLNKKLVEAENTPNVIGTTRPTVKIGKTTYEVVSGARIQRVNYTAKEIAADKDLAELLIKKNSAILRKIEK